MIRITEKQRCCGCSACQAACPKNCIALEADEEGFLYPSVNMDNCIKCRTCLHVCPMIHPAEEKPGSQHGWLVQNKDEAIRMDSSSGGALSTDGLFKTKMRLSVWTALPEELSVQ